MKSWLIGLVLATGCATTAGFVGPDGKRGFSVNCSGPGYSIATCYEKAHESCGGNYKIVDSQNAQRTETDASGQAMLVDHREITVVCEG